MTRTSLPALTDRIALGAHHHVSPFCLGMTFEPRMIPACFDAGVNFFFVSCDLHWPLYDGLRRGLEMLLARGGGIRDDIVIATASYISQTAFGGSGFYELLAERGGPTAPPPA